MTSGTEPTAGDESSTVAETEPPATRQPDESVPIFQRFMS